MNQGLIPRRYAKALYLLATEQGAAADVYAAMIHLAEAFSAEPALHKAMANPHVSAADKQQLVMSAAQAAGNAEALVADMVKLLEKNRRMEFVREMALAYVAIYRLEHKIYSVVITSAVPLQKAELERIHSLVNKHLPEGSTAEFSEETNPDLIGGFIVSIDNELLDASVSNELKQLRLKLLSH